MTTVREAAMVLLSVCDGAISRDLAGYNKPDAGAMRRLLSWQRWTEKQQHAAKFILLKYKNQLSLHGISYDDLIPEPTVAAPKADDSLVIVDYNGRDITIRSPKRLLESIRTIPGRRWNMDTFTWDFNPQHEDYRGKALVVFKEVVVGWEKNDIAVLYTEAADGIIHKVEQELVTRGSVVVDVIRNVITIKSPFELRDEIKKIPGHRWDKTNKIWTFDGTRDDVISAIPVVLKALEDKCDVQVSNDATQYLESRQGALVRFQEQVGTVDAIKSGEIPDIPVPLKTKPFDHQKRAFAIAIVLDAIALLMEMGTGKTLAAIAAAGKRFLDGQVKKLLIFAPLSVVDVWEKEFEKHAAFPFEVHIVRGDIDDRKEAFNGTLNEDALNVRVVNYDATITRCKVSRDDKGKIISKDESGGLLECILDWEPDMVILDESQRIKNRTSKRAQVAHKVGDIVKYKMILTGTPITNEPLDIWSQYRFLNKDIFGDNFYRFRAQYTRTHKEFSRRNNKEYSVVDGYINVDRLIERAHSIAYRVTKAEALDLPEITHETLVCDLIPQTREYYDKMRNDFALQLGNLYVKAKDRSGVNLVITMLLRLSQITGGFLPLTDGEGKTTVVPISDEKLNVLHDFVEDFPNDKKLVIFCRFLPEIGAIMKMLTEMNISAEKLTGDTKDRGELIARFQDKDDPRVIVVQIATGGLGITLHRADTAIFYSYDYSYAGHEQAMARLHRIGQKNAVTYISIVARNTIDEIILGALSKKKNVADVIVDQLIEKGVFNENGVMMA